MVTSAPKRQAIGLLGGTFDPIHHGHLRLGWEAFSRLSLQQLILMPCHQPPHRAAPGVKARDRLAMVELACQDVAGFVVSDWEIQRDCPSYSVDTLDHLRASTDPATALVFIMGMDAFHLFTRWHDWQRILQLCHLWIAQRPHATLPAADSAEASLIQTRGVDDPSELCEQPAGRLYLHTSTDLAISATGLRTDIGQGKDPRFLVPDAVWRYIQQRSLYGPTSITT